MKLAVGISISLTLILNCLSSFAQPINTSHWNLNTDPRKRTIEAAVTKYYESKTFMMSISVYLEYPKFWQHYVLDYLSDALTDSKLMKYEIFLNTNNRLQRVTKVSYHNLWYVDSYKAFRSILVAVRNDYRQRMCEYVVIMDAANCVSRRREVQLILEKSFELNIVNIVVAVYVGNATFTMYSYDIFTPDHCREVVVKQVNIFENGHFRNEELFPYKFNNFYNCPLTIYIRNASLFYRFNLTQDGTQIASIEGVEANMIQTMAERLNFKLHMYYLEPADNVGTVYENGTAVGPFRFLIENKLDILLGYHNYPVRGRYFGASASYAFMPLVIVIREYKRNDFVETWPFKQFSPMTWSIFGLSSFVVIVLVQLSHYYFNKRLMWLDIVGLVLGISRPLRIKSYMARASLLLCIFGIMIISAIFQGRLYYVFNSQDVSKLTNIQQLIKANYTFLFTRRFDNDLIRNLHIPSKQIHYVDTFDDCMIYEKMCKYSSNTATLTNYWDFQMHVESKKCNNEFRIMPMIVILNQICAYMKSHSYLIEPINRIIKSLHVGGIFNKWKLDLVDVGKSNEIGLITKHMLSNTPQPLTLDKFKIVFAGLIFFYILSILTFLGEFIVRDWKKIVKQLGKIKCFRKK